MGVGRVLSQIRELVVHMQKNKEAHRIPVLQPLRAANEEFPGTEALASRLAKSGWDAREVWRTRIKAERDPLPR
jgi:hypothetical protein